MNRNTLLAFALMVIVVIFFNSSMWNSFWYGTILKQPVPTRGVQPKSAAQSPEETSPASSPDRQNQAGESKSGLPGEQKLSAVAGDSLSAHPDSTDIEDSAPVVQLVEDTITVETNRVIASISTKGARIVSLKMKEYAHTYGSQKGELIDVLPPNSVGGAQLRINDESFDEYFFTIAGAADDSTGTSAIKHITVDAASGYGLVLETKSSSGRPVQKEFKFADDTYKIGYTIRGENIIGQRITTGWAGGIEEPESGQDLPFGQVMDRRRAHFSNGKTLSRENHIEMKKKDTREPSGMFRWVGISSKYFFVALVAEKTSDADLRIEGRGVGLAGKEALINYAVYYQTQAEANEIADWIYAGPNGIKELVQHDLKFEKALFPVLSWARHIFWADAWFPPLAEIVLWLLLFFYSLVKDYGVAIFLLTLLLKVVTFPMTQSSAKSMLRMKDLQPKLLKLREKHKGNPQKLNEEMMALYKAEGVNPFNPGCLPMFLQMPIFIALFIVLRKAIELRGAESFLLFWVKDLSQPEALFHLPFALPLYGSNVALMPIIMAALTFFQQRAMIQDPNQKAMVYIMPPLMLVMFNSFPAGVVFYWTLSSAMSVAQQKLLPPKINKPAVVVGTIGGGTTAASPAAGPVHTRHKAPMRNRSSGKKKRK